MQHQGRVVEDQPAVRVPNVNLLNKPAIVADSAPINEADPDGSEVTIPTGKVAVLVPSRVSS